VKKAKKIRSALGAAKKRNTVSSTSPLGLLALHLLQQWRDSGYDRIVFLAENENRAERLGMLTKEQRIPSSAWMTF
jgi:transcription-repair coupling factor (superfamily II helicase)